jgi:hypothetical protein
MAAAMIIDNTTRTASGTSKSKGNASGIGSISGSDTFETEPLDPILGDGSWTLKLLDLATLNNKVTGQAQVLLGTGKTYDFTVKGAYKASTGLSKLVVQGLDTAKPSSLVVTLGPENTIVQIKGRIFGQTINASF